MTERTAKGNEEFSKWDKYGLYYRDLNIMLYLKMILMKRADVWSTLHRSLVHIG